MIEKLMSKVGLDRDMAEKVGDFIKEHADDIPGWVASAGVKDKLPGGLGKLF
jgi:ABC-type proline/glycine betaine transport system substrate-binding protein